LVVTAGVSTFTSGPILVGSATSTGTPSQRLQVTGGAYVSGNLGVGVTNPSEKLEVNGRTVLTTGTAPFYGLKVKDYTNTTGIYVGSVSGGSAWYIGDSYYYNSALWRTDKTHASSINFINGTLEFYTNTGLTAGVDYTPSRKMILDSSGNLLIATSSATGTASQPLQVNGGAYVSGSVGIGTTSPGQQLSIYGAGGDVFQLWSGTTSSGSADTGNAITFSGHDGSINGRLFGRIGVYKENSTVGDVSSYMSFSTRLHPAGTVEKVRINSAGNLLVGTTNAYPSSTSTTIGIFNGTILCGNTSAITTSTSGGNDTAIICGGDIEIARDGVAGTQRHGRIRGLGGSAYTGGLAFDYFYYNGTSYVYNEGLRIDQYGSVGIGTITPFAKTHIEINAAAGASSGSAAALWLRNSNQTANNSATIFAGNNSSQASAAINFIHNDYTTNAGAISFDTRTNSSTYAERMRIDSAGMVTTPYQPSWNLRPNGSGNVTTTTGADIVGWTNNTSGTSAKLCHIQGVTLTGSSGGILGAATSGRINFPVAGRYKVWCTIRLENNPGQGNIYLFINGVSLARQHVEGWRSTGTVTPYTHGFQSQIINVAANDYLEIQMSVPAGASISGYNDVVNWCGGYLIG